MVAEPRRPRILALMMVLAFLAMSWAPTSTAQLELVLPEIHVIRGKVDINPIDSNAPNVVPGDDVLVRVTLENRGDDAALFPVYAYLQGRIEQTQCRTIKLDADKSGTVTFHFGGSTGHLAAGDNLVTILANEPWNSAWGDAPTCTGSPAVRDEDPTDDDWRRVARHVAWGHFVVNHTIDLKVDRIRWCSGAVPLDAEQGCDTEMKANNRKWSHNVTAYESGASAPSTFFVIDVMNQGNHTSLTNFGHADCKSDAEIHESTTHDAYRPNPATCGEFDYDVQLRITPLEDDGSPILLGTFPEHDLKSGNDNWENILGPLGPVPEHVTFWISDGWALTGLKGGYKATVNIDANGTKLTENATVNNQGVKDDIEVRWVNFNITLGETFRTTIEEPYPYRSGTQVAGLVNFTNSGKADATADERPVNISIHVDDGKFADTRTIDSGLLQGQTFSVPYSFDFNTDPEDPKYLTPGAHTLTARIDKDAKKSDHYNGHWNETDEDDNVATLTFYVEDNEKPVFKAVDELAPDSEGRPTDNPLLRNQYNSTYPSPQAGPSDTVLRPHEPILIRTWVTDGDDELTVVANFTYDDDPNVSVVYPLSYEPANKFYRAGQINLKLHDPVNETRSEQNWTMRITARDATGNEENSTSVSFKLQKWDIHHASEDYIVLGQEQNRTINWTDDTRLFYRILLLDNTTGVHDQWNNTANVKLIIDPPGDDAEGQPYEIPGTQWERVIPVNPDEKAACIPPDTDLVDNTTHGIGDSAGNAEDAVECRTYGQIETRFWHDDPGSPGLWNATIVVADKAGVERAWNRTFHVLDKLPTFEDFNLTDLEGATIEKVEAGQQLGVTVSMIDDFDINASAVHVNFTRTDGVWRNLTLDEHEAETVGETKRYWFNKTFDTGRFTELDLAGTFNVSVHAADVNGNWNRSRSARFVIEDTVAPTLDAGVTPSEQEDGEEVTFWARSTDQTNVTVKLVVSRDNTEVYNATLDHLEGNNYSHTTNFTATGRYAWTMIAYDGNVGPLASETRSGNLVISDNLGPRFEIRSPGFNVDGVRYANAAPRLEVLLYDADSVDDDSIMLSIDGIEINATDYDLEAPPAGFRGYTLVYDMPQNYEHNDTVVVRLNATDLSNKSLSNEVGFSFRIDDSAPVSRMVSFEPRYRALEGHVWNVSLDTEFTLSALDVDGLPTDVESIRFTIIGGGSSTVETVYNGPFKIRDIPDAYTGPRIYLIQFYAEDDVGNRERPANQISVSVDDTPPQLDPFGSLPQGRFVNVTFVDDASGVDKAVAWYRLNDAPYKSLALERDGDIWRGVLPEGKKDDRMSYYLEAWDRVGNSDTAGNDTEPYSSYTVGNHLPVIRITSPLLGQRVNANVELEWTASDEDDDDLSFKVYLKAPGRANFAELITLDATDARSHVIDSTQFADGQYVLAVTASDGTFVSRAETTVTFINSGRAIQGGGVSDDRVTPDEGVLITASIRKAQAVVEARVYRNGEFVEAFAMNDDGESGDLVANDGIYSVRASFARSGEYSVEILSRYQENGEAKEDRMVDAASFTVSLTPGSILAEYWILWLGLVTLAFAAVGVAGFGLYKKWR